jgi:aminoglycoside phosphotransferase (APT) family kinase protein
VLPEAEVSGILQRAFPRCRIQACTKLEGGISARAMLLDVQLEDTTQKRVVVRRPVSTTRSVRVEYAVLRHLIGSGVPAPKPCFLDVSGQALVLEYVEGAPEFAPADADGMIRQMATHLAGIHRVGITSELGVLPRRREGTAKDVRQCPEQLDATLDEPRVRSALTVLWPWQQYNADVLLHGDYWPGNLLWRDGKLVAVLDWEETEIGDPLADVSIARLDMLWAFGEAAMHTFTERYREQTEIDWRNLGRWDLWAALRPMSNLARWAAAYAGPPICRPDVTERSMCERHRFFVAQALRSSGIDA